VKVLLLSIYDSVPVGLRYIAAFLEKHGHECVVVKEKVRDQAALQVLLRRHGPDIVGLTCYSVKVYDVLAVAQWIKKYNPALPVVMGNIHATVYPRELLTLCRSVDYIVRGEGEIPLRFFPCIPELFEGACL
jgi:anaerobic magnesium-protoporphyrin IX monomethyl ester cyclase